MCTTGSMAEKDQVDRSIVAAKGQVDRSAAKKGSKELKFYYKRIERIEFLLQGIKKIKRLL